MKRFFLLALAASFAVSASAEGYQVNTLSAKQLGMAHTGVSQKLNSESVWFNPAAAVHQDQKFTASAGVTLINAKATFTELNNYLTKPQTWKSDNDLSTPMYFNLNYKINDKLSAGFLLNTPFGSSMNWGDDWAGAHLVQNISLQAYNAQPTLSYKINDKLSIGAGLMISWGSFELSRSMFPVGADMNGSIDALTSAKDMLYAAAGVGSDPATTAQWNALMKSAANTSGDSAMTSATLSGDADVAFGFNVGIFYDINSKWSLGASYRSNMKLGVDAGHAKLNYNADLNQYEQMAVSQLFAGMESGSFSAELPMPSTLSFGVTYNATEKLSFATEFQWVKWSAYDNLVVTFNEEGLSSYDQNAPKNYSNTMMIRVGAEYDALDWLTARVGAYIDESPVASDYLNPETPSMTKIGYTLGLSIKPLKSNRNLSLDLAYGYITSADPERTGSYPYQQSLYSAASKIYAGLGQETAAQQAALSSLTPLQGNYTTKAHTFAIGLSWGF